MYFAKRGFSTYSEMWTKISSPPSNGVIKPCPFSLQNVLIVPSNSAVLSILSDLKYKSLYRI